MYFPKLTQICADEGTKQTTSSTKNVEEHGDHFKNPTKNVQEQILPHVTEDMLLETEKDRIIANLKKQLEDLEERNKEKLRRKESEMTEQLIERQ